MKPKRLLALGVLLVGCTAAASLTGQQKAGAFIRDALVLHSHYSFLLIYDLAPKGEQHGMPELWSSQPSDIRAL